MARQTLNNAKSAGLSAAMSVLLLAGPAHAADMAFFVKNLRSQGVAVELFSRDRDTVWPGGDKVFLVEPGTRKSIPITCNAGERICYGAWVNGNDAISAGVGPDNDRKCDDCCFTCVEKSTETIDLTE